MACKYYAPNGKSSKLFDSLFSHFSKYASDADAERMSAGIYLYTRTLEFKEQFGDWQSENMPVDPLLLAEVKSLSKSVTGIYEDVIKSNPKRVLRDIAEQAMLGNRKSLENAFPARMIDIALEIYGEVRIGANKNVTVPIDDNGEPEISYINDKPGFGNNQSFQYLEDLKFNPFKPENENRRIVNTSASGSPENIKKVIAEFEGKGLKVNSIRTYGNVSYISGTTDMDNVYFNDDVLSKSEAMPIANFIQDGDNSARILKSIIKNPVNDDNIYIASQIAISTKKPVRISLMNREDINEQYPSIKSKDIVNMFFDASKNIIVINNDININAAEFENIILEEIIHATTVGTINGNSEVAQQWENQYLSAKKAMNDAKMDSRFLVNSSEFLYGILKDKTFRSNLSKVATDKANTNLLDSLMNWLMSLFGMRKSQTENVREMLDVANAVLRRSLTPIETSYMADVVPEEETNPQLQSEIETAETERDTKNNTAVSNDAVTEQFSGSKLFDKYIETLMEKKLSLRRASQNKAGKDKKRALSKENVIYSRHLNELQNNLTYGTLIRIGRVETERLGRHIDNVTNLSEISENLKLLDAWRSFSSLITSDAKNEGIELDNEVMFHVNAVNNKASVLYNDYYEKYFESFTEGLKDQHVPPDVINGINIDMTIEDIGSLAASFIGLSYGQNPIEQVADFLIRRNAWQINNEWIDWEKQLEDHLKTVDGNIDFLFKTDVDGKKRLVTRYNSDMHEKMMKMRSEIIGFDQERKPLVNSIRELRKQFAAAKNAHNIDLAEQISEEMDVLQKQLESHKKSTKSWDDYYEFMRQNFDYNLEMSEEDTARWEDFKEALRDSYADITGGEEGLINEYAYQAELSKYDPQRFINWVKTGENRPSHGAMWFKATPKAQWLNNAYFDTLTTDQKNFYDWFTNEFVKAQENIPQEDPWFGEYEMDKVIREFSFFDQNGLSKMKYLGNTLKDWAADLVTVKYQESDKSNALKAPLSKRPVEPIKFKKIKDLINKQSGYFKTGDELPAGIQKLIADGVYKFNEDGYLVKSSNGFLVKNITQDKVDPLKVFTDFKKFSLSYKYKKQVEDYLNTAKELAYNAEVVQTTTDGRAIKKFGKVFTAKGKNNLDGRLSATVDKYLYDKTKDPIGSAEGKPGERSLSLPQFIETLNNFTRARALGLNFASGVTNLAIGTISNFQYAGRDEFFNEKELRKAYWIVKDTVAKLATGGKVESKDAAKIMMMVRKFNLFGNFQEEFFLNTETMTKLFNHLFAFQKGGEYMNQGAVMIAMMLRSQVDAGNGKKISVWDAYDVKNGSLVVKDGVKFDDEAQRRFGNGMLQVNKEIHGDYDPLNMQTIKKKQIGRILMMLRTWMPMAIKQRTGKKYTDYILSEFSGRSVVREGRWRTLGRTVGGKGFVSGTGSILKLVTASMVSTVSNQYGRKIIDSMGIAEEDKANMYANMKELWWLLAMTTLGVIFKKMGEDDDKDKDPDSDSWYNYFVNQSMRVSNDLWFYYDPISAYKIVRDPVAIGGTLKETVKLWQSGKNYIFDNEHDIYTRGFRKGDSKFATQLRMFSPVIRQGDGLFSMFSQIYSNETIR